MPELIIVRKSKKQATSTGDAPEKMSKQELKRERINVAKKKSKKASKEIIHDTSALNAKELEQEERDREEAREEFEEEMLENGVVVEDDDDDDDDEQDSGDDKVEKEDSQQ